MSQDSKIEITPHPNPERFIMETRQEETTALRAAKEFIARMGLFSNSTSREVIALELVKELEAYPRKLAVAEAARAGFAGT